MHGLYAGKREVEHPLKVVLPDIQISKVNGIEGLQKIKADPRTKLIPGANVISSKENLGFYWLLLNQPAS